MISTSSVNLEVPAGTSVPSVPESKVTKLIHTWTIDNISYHCDAKLDFQDYLDSAKFSQHKSDQEKPQFFIRLHPRGDKQNLAKTKNHIPVYVHMESKVSVLVIVNVKLYIVKQSGENVNIKGIFY